MPAAMSHAMKARRLSRQQFNRILSRNLQLEHLKGVAEGRHQTWSPREEMYVFMLKSGLRPDINDFVLSDALFSLEQYEFGIKARKFGPGGAAAREAACSTDLS